MSFLKKLFAGQGPLEVRLQPSGAHFAVPSGETILERALKEGLAYPHDCTVGTCGSCRSRLIEGKVQAITPFGYTLSREELEAGYILACQALPRSELVLEVSLEAPALPAARSFEAQLIGLDDLTHDIKRARFSLNAPLDYLAGQYVNLSWPGDTRSRSYSFCQKPMEGGRSQISTFIRRVPGGGFTEHLFSSDPFGTSYRLDGPHGNFWLREADGPILCVAGGSGLAPIISLLEDAAARGVARDCILLFGARTERDLYATEEIAAIAAAWKAGFEYRPILSEQSLAGFAHGLVTNAIAPALNELGRNAHAYMCGPPPMIDAGVAVLTSEGIALEHVHYDKFTDASHLAPA
jgi:p-cymene monooxygenase electron transfer component